MQNPPSCYHLLRPSVRPSVRPFAARNPFQAYERRRPTLFLSFAPARSSCCLSRGTSYRDRPAGRPANVKGFGGNSERYDDDGPADRSSAPAKHPPQHIAAPSCLSRLHYGSIGAKFHLMHGISLAMYHIVNSPLIWLPRRFNAAAAIDTRYGQKLLCQTGILLLLLFGGGGGGNLVKKSLQNGRC